MNRINYHKSEQDLAHSQKPGISSQGLPDHEKRKMIEKVNQELITKTRAKMFHHASVHPMGTLGKGKGGRIRNVGSVKGRPTLSRKQISAKLRKNQIKYLAKGVKVSTTRTNPRNERPHFTHTDAIQNRLKSKSPWFCSIKDPKQNADVKIPDMVGAQTGTIQLVERVTLTANAGGVAGLRVICPYPNLISSLPYTGCNYQWLDSTATTSASSWWNGTTAGACAAFTGSEDLEAFARGCRVVSASVTLQPEMSGLNDQGEMIAWQLPFDNTPNGASFTTYSQMFGSSIVPVNTKGGIVSLWYPYKRNQTQYDDFFDTNISSAVGIDDGEIPPWEFGCVAHGCVANSAIRAEIVINYEYLLKENTTNLITTTDGISDSMEKEFVEGNIQEEPTTGIISAHDIDKPPSASNQEQKSPDDITSGFDFSWMEEVLPIVGGALGLLL